MNDHLNPIFQNILNSAAKPRLIAMNSFHYNNPPGVDRPFFTLIGLRELSFAERNAIERAFYGGYLGDTYVFEEYTEMYEEVADELCQVSTDEETQECAPDRAADERMADKCHEDEKDKRWCGRWGMLYERGSE